MGYLRTDTAERMGSMATVKASAMKHKMGGGGTDSVDPSDVHAVVDPWPAAPKKTAEKMLEFYGPPNEATPTKMFWYRSGPWRRIELTSDEVVHNFPPPQTDFLTQYIDYRGQRARSPTCGASTAASWSTARRGGGGEV